MVASIVVVTSIPEIGVFVLSRTWTLVYTVCLFENVPHGSINGPFELPEQVITILDGVGATGFTVNVIDELSLRLPLSVTLAVIV